MKKTVSLGLMLLAFISAFSQSTAPSGNSGQTATIKAGSMVTLMATAPYADSFQWFKDNQSIPGAVENKYIAREEGLYWVEALSANCISVPSDPVQVIILPGSAFSADLTLEKTSEARPVSVGEIFKYTLLASNKGSDGATALTVTDDLPEELEFIDVIMPSKGAVTYNSATRTVIWTIPQLENGETLEVKIQTRALRGGIVTNTASIAAFESDPDLSNNSSSNLKEISGLRIPNVFSPNGDGVNDRYKIPGLETYTENEFTVINRWGNHVFEKKQYQDEWTGDGLNEGTYFYVLRVKAADGNWNIHKGYITLLRSK